MMEEYLPWHVQRVRDLMVLKVLDAVGLQHGYGIARRIEVIPRSGGSSRGDGSLQSGKHRKTIARRSTIRSKERPKTARERNQELGEDIRGDRAPVETGGPGVMMIHYLRALAARLRGLFGDRRANQELDDEIEMHLRLLTKRYVRQGMTEAEAARAARRQFGNITLLQEVNREMHGIRFIETLLQDLRYGLWMLGEIPASPSWPY